MSKIKISTINDYEIEVSFASDIPMELVNQLVSSFTNRGLHEDLHKSTLSKRYFSFIDESCSDGVADDLIKTLETMAKGRVKYPFSSEAEKQKWREKNLRIDREKRIAAKKPKFDIRPSSQQKPPIAPTTAPTLFDPDLSGKVDYKRLKKDEKQPLKKGWGQHLPFPKAELQATNHEDNSLATQLATLMSNKNMLGQGFRQPSSEEMIMAGEKMGLGTSEEMVKAGDNKWNNTINNWLTEAAKPISQRFNSEEEELAYWNSLKISDKADDSSGY